MEQQTQAESAKQLIAKSTAMYRGFFIIETPDGGCTFFIGPKQYDCLSLDEATAAIDAIYARIKKSTPTV